MKLDVVISKYGVPHLIDVKTGKSIAIVCFDQAHPLADREVALKIRDLWNAEEE